MAAQSPPDLSTQQGRDAYRAELRGVARLTRLLGFIVVVAGAGLLIVAKSAGGQPAWALNAGWVLLGAGWLVLAWAMVQRTLYNRRRMAGGSAGNDNAR
ncbi:MAG: hypothetical protein U1E03_15505 [Hyphomonadaceae bacterium]